jgi:single-stranded-DNA-specific exonuclease
MRSARGFDLTFILQEIGGLFEQSGGHDFAAGFTLLRKNWTAFEERLAQYAARLELGPEQDEAEPVDAEIPSSYMNIDLLKVIDTLEPYGCEYKELNLLCCDMTANDPRFIGKEANHLQMTLSAGNSKWRAVYFKCPDDIRWVKNGVKLDVLFSMRRDYYQGKETPQLIINAIRPVGGTPSSRP